MNVIVAGCRNIELIRGVTLVADAIAASGWASKIKKILHGGAKGIDEAAGVYAKGVWPIDVYPAKWNLHGKRAGPIRNEMMALQADALIAIWEGKSRGTKSMIEIAKRYGLQVFVFEVENEKE